MQVFLPRSRFCCYSCLCDKRFRHRQACSSRWRSGLNRRGRCSRPGCNVAGFPAAAVPGLGAGSALAPCSVGSEREGAPCRTCLGSVTWEPAHSLSTCSGRAHRSWAHSPTAWAGKLTRGLAIVLGVTGLGFLQPQWVPLSGSGPAWSSQRGQTGLCEGLGSRARGHPWGLGAGGWLPVPLPRLWGGAVCPDRKR